MSKEAIIDKILADAESRADAMVGEAAAKAEGILAAAKNACDMYTAENKAVIETAKNDAIKRGRTVAELDAKKLTLKAKAEIIDRTFSRALEKAKSLDKATYKKLILGMLDAAEDGDVVTISKREKGIITEKDVEETAKRRGIKLSLNKTAGDFDGGVILSNRGVDKNLTLDVELAVLRDGTEAEVAKELFK